jgi:DNA-directed RNA polymerase specialized sigma24 family protein
MEEADLEWVFGAAVKAAASPETAERAVVHAIEDAAASGGAERRELMARAVRRALSETPCASLAILPPPQREAIALARIVGMGVEEIARVVGCDPRDVKSRLTSGLRALGGALQASA